MKASGPYDVIVLGGGPAGLATSIAAARRGMRVLVADASQPPADKACGEGLMPDSQTAASRIGIVIPASLGHPFQGIRFCDGGTSVASRFPAGAGLGVRRTVLHRHLAEGAAEAGVQLLCGHPFTAIDGNSVRIGDHEVRAQWIVGADGLQSSVRRWADLDQLRRQTLRFGYRQHFPVAPWSEFMEIHWADGCQLYVTPVAAGQICVVLMSRDPHLRLRTALPRFPELGRRLRGQPALSAERGSPAGTRLLRRVTRRNIALVGDASGNVDAITGEGLCLVFQQADSLAAALQQGDLSIYERAHRALMRRPVWMGDLMLSLDRWPWLRRRVIPALAGKPDLFQNLLTFHVGEAALSKTAATAAGLARGLLRQ